jgi:hypothetical protein
MADTDPSPSDTIRKRTRQYRFIQSRGFEVMPCDYCRSHSQVCLMTPGGRRCQECALRGYRCKNSGGPISSRSSTLCPFVLDRAFTLTPSVSHITDELEKLDQKELDEESRLKLLQSQLSESFERLRRVREQKRFLHRRGLKALQQDEPPDSALEEAPTVAESQIVDEVRANGGVDVIDWSGVGLDLFDFSTPDRPEVPLERSSGVQ